MAIRSILGVSAGWFAWSLAEYVSHRWVMHAGRGTSPLADEHMDHHGDPSATVPLAPDVHNLGYKGAALVLTSVAVAPSFGVGFTGGYAVYTYLHDRMHHRPPRSALARLLWRHHYRHHFGRPGQNLAVTNPCWDVVFGTRSADGTPIKVPAARAPSWLGPTMPEVEGFIVQ
jgi:sterol desaturase/sphingolipid hydroxylase (fatty acid hydroxylase superfamily)